MCDVARHVMERSNKITHLVKGKLSVFFAGYVIFEWVSTLFALKGLKQLTVILHNNKTVPTYYVLQQITQQSSIVCKLELHEYMLP